MGFIYSSGGNVGIKDKFIRRFKSFHELKTYARKAPDPELLGKIKVCKSRVHMARNLVTST